MTRYGSLAAFLLLGGSSLFADEPKKVSYSRDILPLFQQNCIGCHQPAKAQGGYVMTSREALLKRGDTDQIGVVPGKPNESNLLSQLVSKDASKKPAMPKGADPLPEKDVALITRWIAEGANVDTPVTKTVIDQAHPPIYTSPPVVTALDFSPDGTLLAVAGFHEVLLYKSDGSALAGRLVGLAERIQSLKFSPDGKLLLAAGGSPGRFGEVQVWDVAKKTLKMSKSITYDTLYGASWSPDAKLIAFGCGDNSVRAVESESGKQALYQGAHTDWVLDTVFSRDGDYLASVSRDMTIKLTETATQRFIDNVTSITPGALKGGIQAVARRPFKERTVVKTTNVEIGDVTREKAYDELLIGGHDGVPRLYRMHRTSKRVIGDDSNKVRDFDGLPGRIFALDFSPNGERFVAGSSADGKGEVRVYNATDGKKLSTFEGQKGAVYAVVYSPDGKTVASAGFDGEIRLNDGETGKLIKEFVCVPLKK